MRVIPSDEERADWVPGIGGAGLGFGDEESVYEVSDADGLEFLQAGGCTVSAAAHTLAAHVSRTLVQGVTDDGTASSSSSSSAATDALDLFRALRDPENAPDVPSPVRFFFIFVRAIGLTACFVHRRPCACTPTIARTWPRGGARRALLITPRA